MRSSSGSERSPAAILATLPPAAQIVLQESDDEDDDPVLVSSTQAATNAGIPPVITEPPPGSQAPQLPESQASDLDSDEFEVEVILNHRFSGTKKKPTTEFYVKWKGYPDSENTWEPEGNFHEALIRDYWSKQPSDSRRKKKTRLSSILSSSNDDYEQDDQVDLSRELSEEITSTPKSNGKRKTQQDSPATRKTPQQSTPKPKKRVRLSRGDSSADDGDDASYRGEDAGETEAVRQEQVDGRTIEEIEEERKATKIQQVKDRLLKHYRDRFHRWETVVDRCVDMMQTDNKGGIECLLEFNEPVKYARALNSVGLEVDDDTGVNACIWVDNSTANERCPQKMIDFFQAHIKFGPS